MSSAGYLWQLKRFTLEPFGSLQYSYLQESAFDESGAGSVSLAIEERSTESLVFELGLRLAYVLQAKSLAVVPGLSVAWNYDFDIDDRR